MFISKRSSPQVWATSTAPHGFGIYIPTQEMIYLYTSTQASKPQNQMKKQRNHRNTEVSNSRLLKALPRKIIMNPPRNHRQRLLRLPYRPYHTHCNRHKGIQATAGHQHYPSAPHSSFQTTEGSDGTHKVITTQTTNPAFVHTFGIAANAGITIHNNTNTITVTTTLSLKSL